MCTIILGLSKNVYVNLIVQMNELHAFYSIIVREIINVCDYQGNTVYLF